MTPPDSAAKEAWEEAGLIGQVEVNQIGIYNYQNRGDIYQIEVFLLSVETVLSDWPEASLRKRQWLSATKAVKWVKLADLKRILKTPSDQIKLLHIRCSSVEIRVRENSVTLLKEHNTKDRRNIMLVELSIIPLGGDTHLSTQIAEVLNLIDASELPYQLTPSGTCIEGEWDTVMPLIRKCHNHARSKSSHVITTIKIEDEAGEQDKLTRNTTSVEEKVGRTLKKGEF